MANPGLGEHEMARLLSVPDELVEFHLWYLKDKGWVVRLDSGLLAITAPGVDQVEQSQLRLRPDRLLEAHLNASMDAEKRESSRGAPLELRDRAPAN
jgi:hypothetical protein